MKAEPAVASNPEQASGAQNLRHGGAIKFKASTAPGQIRQAEAEVRGRARQIPVVAGFEWGFNFSAAGFDKGFTHGFIVTFRTEPDRDAYLKHPEHTCSLRPRCRWSPARSLLISG